MDKVLSIAVPVVCVQVIVTFGTAFVYWALKAEERLMQQKHAPQG